MAQPIQPPRFRPPSQPTWRLSESHMRPGVSASSAAEAGVGTYLERRLLRIATDRSRSVGVRGVQGFNGSSAAKTAARLSTITPPALVFGKYTTTLRPDPVAEGNTILSIPASMQIAPSACDTLCEPRRSERVSRFCNSGGTGRLRSKFRWVVIRII